MKKRFMILFAMLAETVLFAETRYEAETVIVNQEATVQEARPKDKWSIWSTDINKKNWSGGVVVRTPSIQEDDQTHEEGAPILHIRLPIPEPGNYTIKMNYTLRPLGLSLDNAKSWQRFNGGTIVSNLRIDNGFFDCWFDDCYKAQPPQTPGSSYIDFLIVSKQMEIRHGMFNPGFEYGKPGETPPGWQWFNREQQGSAVICEEHKEGCQSLHIVSPDGRDWAVSNTLTLPVKIGEHFIFRCWIKGSVMNQARMELVGYKNGARVTWRAAKSQTFSASPDTWKPVKGHFVADDDIDAVSLRIVGLKAADFYVDELSLEAAPHKEMKPNAPFNGHTKQRVTETLGRGVVAQETDEGVYVSWRLLKEDSNQAAFDLYRKVGVNEKKLNSAPIRQTCDFLDETPVEGATYIVRELNGGKQGEATAWKRDSNGGLAYKSYKLSDPNARIQKVGVGDLNGDGAYDFVVKHPSTNVDPWNLVWKKSPDTYKLEAFLSNGTRLWTFDLGWDIERGIWYSPYCVQDLDGDGKAEVITKIGTGDHREKDGHVYTGDEFFAVLDGMTGKEIDRAPWIRRDHFDEVGENAYHFASRNQICIAYLDGKTPCICIMRGTYDDMVCETWQLVHGKLQRIWSYDNANLSRKWQGQGAHTNYALDVDGDGRDEIVLGSAVIDDNGMPLWTTGKGHPDGVFFGKLMPDKPGLQVAWNLEKAQKKGGLCMADAKTGQFYWELEEPTNHVDSKGMVADIDPLYPGVEIAGADMRILEPGTNNRGLVKGWLLTSDGKILENTEKPTYRFGRWTIYWDADLQKEIFTNRISDHNGGLVTNQIFNGMALIADVIGDWREEIIASPVNGEFRVYTTDLPAMDRRPCLMQEHNYRMRMVANSMGYSTEALLPYDLESEAPNLNGTFIAGKGMTPDTLQLVVVAARRESLKGMLTLTLPEEIEGDLSSFEVDLKPGERMVKRIILKAKQPVNKPARFHLNCQNGRQLAGQVLLCLAQNIHPNGFFVEAEAFTAQKGGEIHIRDDKPGVRGKSISHWDNAGHELTWEISLPANGNYHFLMRYSTPKGARRKLVIDGKELGVFGLDASGGFGGIPYEWVCFTARQNGRPLVIPLKAGSHTIQLENTDGLGLNLDYLGFTKAEN